MKKLLCGLLSLLMILSLCSCSGSFAQIDLQDTIMIPEDGIIEKKIIKAIAEENAIGSFQGESNGFTYEWTIFGSDITEARDINLALEVQNAEDGVSVSFAEQESFGFPALLSVYLNESWDSLSATAYQQGKAVASVSLTGTKNTILNLSVNDTLGEYVIKQDEVSDEIVLEADTQNETEQKQPAENSYLSSTQSGENKVYSSSSSANSSASKGSSSSNTNSNSYLSSAQSSENKVYSSSSSANSSASKGSSSSSTNSNGYLSSVQNSAGRVYSDGSATEKDQYLTDPVPVGKPMPVEPENQDVNKGKSYTCTFSIECSTILNNLSDLDPDKLEMVPSNGVILKKTTVTFYEGESVFDVLQRLCKEKGIHMESSWTPIYNSAYIEGIHNLYEFDCGNLSGWMYRVNGWYPNYGCSRYQLAQGDVVEWRYTCDLGNDVGRDGSW